MEQLTELECVSFYETTCTVASVSRNLMADNKRFITN